MRRGLVWTRRVMVSSIFLLLLIMFFMVLVHQLCVVMVFKISEYWIGLKALSEKVIVTCD